MTSFTKQMRFLDTNILIYAISLAVEDTTKRNLALEILSGGELEPTARVLQEFYVQATRSSRPGALTHREAVEFCESMTRFPIYPISFDVVRAAFDIRSRFGLSYWDSAILAAARLAGCEAVYSEDLSHTQDYDGVQVVNLFA